MNLYHQSHTADGLSQQASLQYLVDRLSCPYLTSARDNKIQLVNTISKELNVSYNEAVEVVISYVLSAVITHARNSRVCISAEKFADLIILYVEDNSSFNSYAVACSLERSKALAQTIGGHLEMEGKGRKVTTITFSFPVFSNVA